LCNNLVNFCDFYYREKEYEVQYEQPVKITETNEPQARGEQKFCTSQFVEMAFAILSFNDLLSTYREFILHSPQ